MSRPMLWLPMAAMLLLPTFTQAANDPITRALLLHSQAVLAEIEGRYDESLALLREAASVAPEDELVAFDRTRLALMHDPDNLPIDARAFMGLEPRSIDDHLLRAYVHMRTGQLARAREELDTALLIYPDHEEGVQLEERLLELELSQDQWAPDVIDVQAQIRPQEEPKEAVPIYVRFRTGTQVDSNVTVLPEAIPTKEEGVRLLLDGSVGTTATRGGVALDLMAMVQYTPHLNDRNTLGLYDMGSLLGVLNLRIPKPNVSGQLQLTVGSVLLDSFAERFMQHVGLLGTADWTVGKRNTVGFFALTRYRDFVFQNAERDPFDRDGGRFELGSTVNIAAGPLVYLASLAGQMELAQGNEFREAGPTGQLRVGWVRGLWDLAGTLSYEYRLHWDSSTARRDHRLIAGVQGGWQVQDHTRLFAAVDFTRNFSQNDFDYARAVGQLGVEASW